MHVVATRCNSLSFISGVSIDKWYHEQNLVAVYFKNSSSCIPSPRTLIISSFSLAEYKFEHAEHAQIVLSKNKGSRLRQDPESPEGDECEDDESHSRVEILSTRGWFRAANEHDCCDNHERSRWQNHQRHFRGGDKSCNDDNGGKYS